MLNEADVREILGVYAKHGWELRRVLLSAETQMALGQSASELFRGVSSESNQVDAAWFSRPQSSGTTAWELRYFGPSPYALVTNVSGERTNGDEFDALVSQLNAAIGRLRSGH